MTAIDTLDLLARGGTLALMLLWGWVMVRDHRHALAAKVALLLVLAVSCHVIADLFPFWSLYGPLVWAAKVGQSVMPAVFWLFARTWFNDSTRVSRRSVAVVLASALVGAILVWLLATRPDDRLMIDIAQRMMWFGFAIAGLVAAYQGRREDLVEGRRRMRMRFVWSVGLYTLLVIGTGFLGNSAQLSAQSYKLINLGVPLLAAALVAALLGARRTDFFADSRAEDAPPDDRFDPNLAPIADAVQRHMQAELAWRDDAITIAKLAAAVGEPEYRVRRTINRHLG
jgi:hypothetical protein